MSRPAHHLALAALASTVGAALLAGCGATTEAGPTPTSQTTLTSPSDAGSPSGQSSPAPRMIGALRPGFVPRTPPAPEGTITPSPGSWDDVRPAPGYRVVLLTSDEDEATRTLAAAVRAWAKENGVGIRTILADTPEDQQAMYARIDEAIAQRSDLVITTGNDLVEPLDVVAPSWQGQQEFLTVGSQAAEPTQNVTGVTWKGGAFRGYERGADVYDPATVTPERAARAIRAGVASVLGYRTGIFVWID